MAGNPTTFKQKPRIKNGNTAQTDLKLADYMPVQHEDINSGVMTINHISVAQSLCQPVATTPNSTPSGGAYTATCSNYPDFSLTYLDKDGNSHYLIGMKVRVIFTTGITYGSVSGGTYPTLNINGSGAIPLLAQGKTMASGACSSGQSLEFTLIPYGNGVAWDADSNVRESTSDYTIYTDGTKIDTKPQNKKLTISSKASIDYNCCIKNGICYLQLRNINFSASIEMNEVIISNLPAPKKWFRTLAFAYGVDAQQYLLNINTDGTITVANAWGNMPSGGYFCPPISYQI